MNVLVIGSGWAPDHAGGLNRYVTSLSTALEQHGLEQEILVLGPIRSRMPGQVTVVANHTDSIFKRHLAFAKAILSRREETAAVVSHFAAYSWALFFMPRRIKVTVHFHGPWAEESKAAGGSSVTVLLKWCIEKLVYSRSEQFIVLSTLFRDKLVDDYAVPPEKISIHHPGVEQQVFYPDVVETEETEVKTFVCVRRLVPRMGVDVLLRAWKEADLVDARLIVVGDGQQQGQLITLAADLDVLESVHFAGRVGDAELRMIYTQAHASIVPSLALEGFGLVALESMACGAAVIGTQVGGLGELLLRHNPHYLCRPGDPSDLARKLIDANAGKFWPTREESIEAASQYSWPELAGRLAETYR